MPGEYICSVQDTSNDFPVAAASSLAISAEGVNEILDGTDNNIEPMETEHNSDAKVTDECVTKSENSSTHEQGNPGGLTKENVESLLCKGNYTTPSTWNDDSNTSICSSDYKTPQQSPNVSTYEIVAAQLEDVEIPDLCEVDSLHATPQLIESSISSTSMPVLSLLPMKVSHTKANDVRTVSVNTDSAPSTVQTISAAKVSHILGRTTTPGQTDTLRCELENKIVKLHRHVRSLSDSAISSDYTDENPASMSPRGSRVCEHGKRLFESEIEKLQSDGLASELSQIFQASERVSASENRKFSSMDNLETVNNGKYLRSLSESNIDDFTEDMDLSNSSNDSITFVFIGDNNSKEKQLQQEYEETRRNGSVSSQSFQDNRNAEGHENEYTDSNGNVTTIENIGYVEDINSNDILDDILSNHSASEEIAEIIDKQKEPQIGTARTDIALPYLDSPHTCTDTSDGLVQMRRHNSGTDDDSAPLRHKFGIDESVLPIAERSMSADNLPKHIKIPPGDLHRSRSTGMLAVGVNADEESESVIFPPKGTSYTDEDHTEPLSHQTISDMDASISLENSGDYNVDSSDDDVEDDKASAIVRSFGSKSTSLEDFQEEFIIGYKANRDRFHYSHASTPSSSPDSDMDPKSIHDQEHIRQVLETVQKFIMPKPTAVDRGTSMESVHKGSETVSIGIQTSDNETNDQDFPRRYSHGHESDHHVLPSLTAPFRAQSMDSIGLGRDTSSLELTENQQNWCTLGELMVETTQLLRRINKHLPELDKKPSGYHVDENQTGGLLKQWQHMSIQTGISMAEVQTIGLQTDNEPETSKSDKETQDDKPSLVVETTQVENDLRMIPLEKSETVMTEMISSSCEQATNEKFLCTVGIQTDYLGGSDFCVQTENSTPLSIEPCVNNTVESDTGTAEKESQKLVLEREIIADTRPAENALPPVVADVKLQPNSDSTDYAAVQSIPGFTVPNTQEIEDLRKEHAKLMENLQKASNKRHARKEAIKARKQTPLEHSQPEIENDIQLDNHNVEPVVNHAAQGRDLAPSTVKVQHKPEKKPKLYGPNKNDPESSLESSRSTEVNEKLLSDDDVELSVEDTVRSDDEEVTREDCVLSDGEDAKHAPTSSSMSIDLNEEIPMPEDGNITVSESDKSSGSLPGIVSPCELTKKIPNPDDELDNSAEHYFPLTGTSSPDEFIQIKIQFYPKTGLVIENKMVKEEKPSVSKGKRDVEKGKEPGSTHEHKWELAGDELRSVWERKPEIKNTVDDTQEPSDISDTTFDKPEDPVDFVKNASSGDENQLSLNAENDQSESSSEDAMSVEGDTMSDKSQASPVREDVIVPDVYTSSKEIPRFPELEEIIPALESDMIDEIKSEEDPSSRGHKEKKPFIKCETSPKLKTQLPRDQQEPASPEIFSNVLSEPFVLKPGISVLDKESPIENDSIGNDETDSGANLEPVDETFAPSRETPCEADIQINDESVDETSNEPVSKVHGKPCNDDCTEPGSGTQSEAGIVNKDDTDNGTNNEPTNEMTDERVNETVRPNNKTPLEAGIIKNDDTDKRTNDEPGNTTQNKPDNKTHDKPDNEINHKLNIEPPSKANNKSFVSKCVGEPSNESQDVQELSTKPVSVPVADDATQINVEMSETETQTDLPSPVFEGGYSDDNILPVELKEELEILQQERQHIMDLLGLTGLPNSLTVELLEAKLNYCIGQTDMLLDNLENYIPSDYEKVEKVGEQTPKDYIKKYREDLKKSKDDIDECRNQLNNRYPKPIGRNRTPLKQNNYLNYNREAEIEAFKLERMREQQDYQRSRHGMPHKGRGNTPLHGNSPVVTPRSDHSRSSSPSYSPGYMTPREHKEHLVDLRRQLIKDVVEEEKQHSRSCSPVLYKSPAQRHRNPSERSQGFSPNARFSISDDLKSSGSSPDQSPYRSKRSVTSPKVPRGSPRHSGSENSNTLSPQNYHTSPLSLNLDCLEDEETSPYSPYSAYAREHLIPNQRASPVAGVLRGTYELYESPNEQSDSSESCLSPDSSKVMLDEDKVQRLRPIQASDIKAKIHRQIR